ncbi:peptidoglycan-binding domain-containing protein [Streptomyces sp. enrichment culture]|uniref:peptidoglycan-binding domain-containing protein n=1 Tax=Streptomyces sp. enrichment culture TaxID=1795815 RepID=UPI003F570CBC
MTGERGSACPECGTPRGPDNTPACDCTERAAEALRETRTAEAAAAEDFDPLRIRPYVTTATPATTAVPPPHTDFPDPPPPPAPAPRPQSSAPERPAAPGPRSRRPLLLAAGGLGAALLAATAFALTSYRTPTHDRAAQEIRQSIPANPTKAPASTPAPAPPAAPPTPPPSSPAPTTPTPSPTPTTPSPTPTPTPTPTRTPSPTPTPTSSSIPPTTPAAPTVLRRGDTGPEVTELQQRLRQLNLYGDRIDGTYTRPVEDAVRNYQLARGIKEDPLGEYGPATRRSLESETRDA